MRSKGAYKIIVVWLLTAIFMIPTIAQAVHTLNNDSCAGTCSHSEKKEHRHNHDCKTCPVCKFTFSQFIESETFDTFIILSRFHHTESITYQERVYDSHPVSNYQRGPPNLS